MTKPAKPTPDQRKIVRRLVADGLTLKIGPAYGIPHPEQYRDERIRRGLTQGELAELLDVSRETISRRETGDPRYPITREAWLALLSVPRKAGAKK